MFAASGRRYSSPRYRSHTTVPQTTRTTTMTFTQAQAMIYAAIVAEYKRKIEQMGLITEVSNALITTTALLSSFIAAGVFTDPNVLKAGVPQGLFNSLCLFIAALYLAIGSLMLSKKPISKLSDNDLPMISGQKHSVLAIFGHMLQLLKLDWRFLLARFILVVCGLLLLCGLSIFLLQVVCRQFDEQISNCRAASIGITTMFSVLFLGVIIDVIVECLSWLIVPIKILAKPSTQ